MRIYWVYKVKQLSTAHARQEVKMSILNRESADIIGQLREVLADADAVIIGAGGRTVSFGRICL